MMDAFRAAGLLEATARIEDWPDALPFLRGRHEAEHVERIRRIPKTGEIAELAVAGALAAVRDVSAGKRRNAFCAVRPPGHHANNTGAEEGFCYFSNAAIAADFARRACGRGRILIVDWDYHHGNATQNAFYDDPSVLFFSTHNWHDYPGTGDPDLAGKSDGTGTNFNVHLGPGATDRDMLAAWDRTLLPAVAVAGDVLGDTNLPLRRFESEKVCRRIDMAWRKSDPRRDEYRVLAEFIAARFAPPPPVHPSAE